VNRYEALKHAAIAHAGQVDKCGKPYILHSIAVAEAIESTEWVFSADPEDAVVVACLHDAWEDTAYRLPPLPRVQMKALCALTHPTSETYSHYIRRVCSNEIACVVKLADLAHNLSPQRQACLPEKEQKSLEKRYLKARDRIWEALGYEWWPEPIGEGK
jgi:(p)ppGpp synthase/HD superfamily hydrolase